MALDGIVIASLCQELNQTLLNTKINKIAQPEPDEILLTLKGNSTQYRLLLSANASLPFVYLTQENKTAPLTAPTFCMVLRKHIANGRIVSITQPGLERILRFEIEHLNEMGDLCRKTLIMELMGKHSNLIFCDQDGTIIDAIKHVSAAVSSLREVLPGRPYFIAQTQNDKLNPLSISTGQFIQAVGCKPTSIVQAIYTSFQGISPLCAHEVAYRANLDGDLPIASLSEDGLLHLANHFIWFMERIRENAFEPHIYYKDREPKEFYCLPLEMYQDMEEERSSSISQVLELYFAQRNAYTRIRQKSVDLRKIVNNSIERAAKKLELQEKQRKDADKREKYRIYGELLQTYGFSLEEGARECICQNYYEENKEIKIPLDPQKSPMENANHYFEKYGKMKRTAEALDLQLEESRKELEHLESIGNALDIAETGDDLILVKKELIEYGFIKKGKANSKKEKSKSKPFHYQSHGFDIYVGKNNYQNDELTFKLATGNDWWFHAKGMPGSHVVVKANNQELPDAVFEDAGRLAAYYSKGKENDKIEIDYLQKKNVKKPAGAAPGFVVYYTNYSLTIHPDISGITRIKE